MHTIATETTFWISNPNHDGSDNSDDDTAYEDGYNGDYDNDGDDGDNSAVDCDDHVVIDDRGLSLSLSSSKL